MKTFVHSFNSFSLNEMAIKSREEMYRPEKIEIDLSGPEGNAFYLMGLARKLYRRKYPEQKEGFNVSQKLAKKFDPEMELKSAEELFMEEMMSGDYDHLLKVFDDEFGDMVTLYR
jgi:hypothetical protein